MATLEKGRKRAKWGSGRGGRSAPGAAKCRNKFLRFFPNGFRDETYIDWERGYKAAAHNRWNELLFRSEYENLLQDERFEEIAGRAVGLESRTNLLFSFEKMALRDAVRSRAGARAFATGLYDFIYGLGNLGDKFARWTEAVSLLPRKQTRVLTWPLVTVFGFLALPRIHMFLKPNVTRIAARRYGFDFPYQSRPSWDTYAKLLELAGQVGKDVSDLEPRDMIDIQSFLWVQGSDEYDE